MDPRSAIALQIAAGVAVVIAVYVASLWLLQNDQLVADPSAVRPPKQAVRILDGYAEASTVANNSWSTINPNAFNYTPMKRSYNRKGGAQFSYSVWLYLRDTSAQNVANKTILMRGDSTLYTWRREPSATAAAGAAGSPEAFSGVLIACPRIAFGDTFDSLAISINTVTEPVVKFAVKPHAESDPTLAAYDPSLRHNALKLIQNRWALLTFTFEDHVAISDFEAGVSVRFYLNDTLYASFRSPQTLKQNNGDFYLLPTIDGSTSIAAATVGNATYYNYAMSTTDAAAVFRAGPPRYAAKTIAGGGLGEPLYLSEYNKLDVYNT